MADLGSGIDRFATVLFAADARPDGNALAAQAEATGVFSISARPDGESGWVELLCNGLTFDVHGLVPGPSRPARAYRHRVALPPGYEANDLAAIDIVPGPHLAGAAHLLPVVRTASALLMALGAMPGVRAVAWSPADTIMSPDWFAEAVGAWLAGGPFPVLALTALYRSEAGGIASNGLAFLTGQEFLLRPDAARSEEDDARIAVRVTDWLVAHGRVAAVCDALLPGGGAVRFEPDGDGPLLVRCR